ncbi:MAG TPA: NfeD family protein [Pyrinomonadaceae bacterium]
MRVALVIIISTLLLVALRSRHHKRRPSTTSLINSTGIVETPLNPNGAVLIGGELWLAKSINGTTIPSKTKVTVVATEAHVLLVS